MDMVHHFAYFHNQEDTVMSAFRKLIFFSLLFSLLVLYARAIALGCRFGIIPPSSIL
jgi:hypothetical protein